MVDQEKQNEVPALPPPGEIVSSAALYNTQISLYRNTLAFGGVRNPSMIWSAMVRNDSSAMLYYRELEEKDTDVANALDTLKEAVLERTWSIQPFDDSDPAAEVAKFIEEQLAQVGNFDGVLDNMLDAPGYGFSVQELTFDVSMGQANLLDIKDCPQELFLFGNRYDTQIGPMQFLTSPYASSGTEVPESKFLIYSHRARSRDRMGRPLLRSVFWASWFKRNMQRLWVQYAEKGPGTAVVRYDDSDSAQQKAQAAEIALAFIQETAVAIPKNMEYDKELLTIARALNPDVYEHFFEAMQKEIVRRVLGETLTSFGGDGGKGTQALGDVHSQTLDTKAIRLCNALSSVLNRQLIRPLVLWNFGPDAPMPAFAFDTEEEVNLNAQIGIDRAVQSMGVPLGIGYLRNKYNIPVPEDGEEIATASATSAAAVTINDTTRQNFAENARLAQWYRDYVENTGRNPSFAEVSSAAAEAEMKQFDALTQQLRDSAEGLLKERVEEVAASLRPGER